MIKKLLILIAVLVVLASSAFADMVKFGDTSISKVPNIVKFMTGKQDFQAGKKSLMFLERVPVFNKGHTDSRYSDTSYMQARIFRLNEDGSLAKSLVFNPVDDTGSMFIQTDCDMKTTRPAISNQATKFGWLAMLQGANGRNGSHAAKFPVQSLPLTVSGNDPSITPQTITDLTKNDYTNFYGSGALTLPTYNGEVFASAHSAGKETLKSGASVTLTLSFIKNTQDGKIEHDTEKDLTVYTVEDDGLYHASIGTGDFDNDGYKNDIGVLIFTKQKVKFFIYTATYDRSNGNVALAKRYEKLVEDYSRFSDSYGRTFDTTPSGNIFCGDFDGDGNIEPAIAYIHVPDTYRWFTNSKAIAYKWNENTKVFEDMRNYWIGNQATQGFIGVKGIAADLNGDGWDEMVLVSFGTWLVNHDTERDLRPDILIANFNGDIYGHYEYSANVLDDDHDTNAVFHVTKTSNFFIDEAFSLVAGPFTGKFGKTKIVDDLALSFTDKTKKVFIIPAPVDDNGEWVFFRRNNYYSYLHMPFKMIYDSSEMESSMSSKYNTAGFFRGGLAVADFLGEGFEISHPEQLADLHDSTYAAIIPAFPYHVDNISPDGTALVDHPVNFTYSGFANSTGKMYVAYNTLQENSDVTNVKFASTGTEDVLFTSADSQLEQAGNLLFQFRRMQSNLFASATQGTKYEALGSAGKKFYDFFNTNMENVTEKMNESSTTKTLARTMQATAYDAVLMYDITTYIWRYKVLSNYIPSWLITGDSINENPISVPGTSGEYYISFSMSDSPIQTNSTSPYQPRHEEGNLFSYPAKIDKDNVEGYNPDGVLGSAGQFEVPQLNPSEVVMTFQNATTMTNQSKQTTTPSEASKTLNFVESAWSTVKSWFTGENEKVQSTPDQTEHGQTFTKKFSKEEKISIIAAHDDSLSDGYNSVGYTVDFTPYVAKEGTIRVAEAVHLNNAKTNDFALFARDNSLYNMSPDPALLLPGKYTTHKSEFISQTSNVLAMKMRGVRFYSVNYGGYSNRVLIPGLTYKIEIPLYNASFVTPPNGVNVRLSYSNTLDPQNKIDPQNPNSTRHIIGTQTVWLKGWTNYANNIADGSSNRGVAVFEWKVPDNTTTKDGNYYFYAEIDPDNAIKEVHESRMSADGKTVRDVGGNNEGYFPFVILRLTEANMQKLPQYLKGSSAQLSASDRVIYASSFVKATEESFDIMDYLVPRVIDINGEVTVKLNGSDDITSVIETIKQAKATNPDDPVTINAEITNSTGTIFPQLLLYGVNLETGNPLLGFDDDGNIIAAPAFYENAFVRESISLFPGETLKLSFQVIPGNVDFVNGWGFFLYHAAPVIDKSYSNTFPDPVIDLTPASGDMSSGEGNSSVHSSGGGCEAGFGSLAVIMIVGLGALIRRK